MHVSGNCSNIRVSHAEFYIQLVTMADSSSSDSDEEMVIFAAQAACTATGTVYNHFIDPELEDGEQNCVDHSCGVRSLYLDTGCFGKVRFETDLFFLF
jgi:hypothetical protein